MKEIGKKMLKNWHTGGLCALGIASAWWLFVSYRHGCILPPIASINIGGPSCSWDSIGFSGPIMDGVLSSLTFFGAVYFVGAVCGFILLGVVGFVMNVVAKK